MAEAKEVNLFSDDVVIIIGAGASVPFGLPTGLDLIDLVQLRLNKEANSFSNLIRQKNKNPFEVITIPQLIRETPIYCSYKLIHDKEYSGETVYFVNAEKELLEIADWLKTQVSDSIDDLIRYNDDKSLLLKICITDILISRTYIKHDHGYTSKEFKERHIEQTDKFGNKKIDSVSKEPVKLRNWIHNFINVVRAQFVENWKTIDSWQNITNKKNVKIISFNYDNILESILEENWNAVSSKLPKSKEIFEIVHPHGKIIHSKNISHENYPKHLHECANLISVIHDGENNIHHDTIPERFKSKQIIENSKSVYSIGFAFAKLNCELIGLTDWVKTPGIREVNYVNFDNGQSLRSRVNKIGGKYQVRRKQDSRLEGYANIFIKETKNENGGLYHITDALIGGFLGEMPS